MPGKHKLSHVLRRLGRKEAAPQRCDVGRLREALGSLRREEGGDGDARARGERLDYVHVLPARGEDDGHAAARRQRAQHALRTRRHAKRRTSASAAAGLLGMLGMRVDAGLGLTSLSLTGLGPTGLTGPTSLGLTGPGLAQLGRGVAEEERAALEVIALRGQVEDARVVELGVRRLVRVQPALLIVSKYWTTLV